jgi:DNA mismatch endonuclease, patch repair protein
VFPTEKVAVFVDGDYWHCRVLVERGLDVFREGLRTANRDYWLEKCQRRVARDREVTAALEADGWMVLRHWESDVKKDLEGTANEIVSTVRARRPATQRR